MIAKANVTRSDIESVLLGVVREFYALGPGYSQESVVLREVANRLHIRDDVKLEEMLLDCWHDLFLNRKLGWGFSIDNPNSPWFHIRDQNLESPIT